MSSLPTIRTALHMSAFWLVLLLIPMLPFVVIGELPGQRWLEGTAGSLATFAAVGTGLLAVDVLLPVPSSIVGILLGGRLGWIAGAGCVALGLTVGHALGFWLGRLAPSRWVPRRGATPQALVLILSRPIPVLAEAITFAAGAGHLPFWSFLWKVALGNAGYGLALGITGASLLPEESYGWTLLALMVLAGLPWLTLRWLKGKNRGTASTR